MVALNAKMAARSTIIPVFTDPAAAGAAINEYPRSKITTVATRTASRRRLTGSASTLRLPPDIVCQYQLLDGLSIYLLEIATFSVYP